MAEHEEAMERLIQVAQHALETGDVPVAAAVMDPEGFVIATATNTKERDSDPTAHAEILALRAAGKALGLANLQGHTLMVTLEPCVMCAGAITQARISQLVFGAWDDKAGAAGSKHDLVRDRTLPHRVEEVIGGVLEEQCSRLLTDFFSIRKS
ncbi:nucleoside deaminase [Pontimonas sp.]|jgi:tRNA(adenine34) deaminase|nr:nucleoside deaminase [Pontimonas sp.]MDA8909444.1 nucleoside deaminase [Pontimonas sp.]|tara:strand:+ start:11460 stop:11918 length:459 start_codon:yes stop_codon:yes gene_type:complete